MVINFLPFQFQIDSLPIAGGSLWATGLYMGFYPLTQWITNQLCRWFNFAERSLYLSSEEFERTRPAREAQNLFFAELVSIFPFLMVGGLCYYLSAWGLGSRSWGVSLGMLVLLIGGVYELGRRNGQSRDY
ncbi:MAG: hypothetical protein HC851_24450 [Acaryochloris sp. RU_4_1]|nr:hypothetical protein [Acaryochloris sp. RU_4_1]NJR57265.1 hypothetical protein [Acaryochloris sp. CRU_2_0]